MTLFRGSGEVGSGEQIDYLRSKNNLSDVDNVPEARSNLGLESLSSISGLTPADSTFIVGDGVNWVAESGATARTSLGLNNVPNVDTSDATNVEITDFGNHYPNDNVENALEELGESKTEIVDSVSSLQSSSFESGLNRIWLSGYYGLGTAGGGPLYRDSNDTVTSDNGGTVFVDTDGVRWKRPKSRFVTIDEFGAKGDNSTINTSRIQQALDWTESEGGGIVYIPQGEYLIDNPIRVGDNTTFAGFGWSSVIRADTSGGALSTTDNDLIGNKDEANGNSNIIHRDYMLDCNDAVSSSGVDSRMSGITGNGVVSWRVFNCKVIDCTGYGIAPFDDGGGNLSDDVIIDGCYVENCDHEIEIHHAKHFRITNNHCVGVSGRSNSCIHLAFESLNGVISGNTVTGTPSNGIDTINICRDIEITGNVVDIDSTGAALKLSAGGLDEGKRITVTGGVYKNSNGLSVNVSSFVDDVIFSGCYLQGTRSVAFVQGGESDAISFIGCTAVCNDTAGNTTAYGIRVGDNGKAIVDSNRIRIVNVDATTLAAVSIESPNCAVRNNFIEGGNIRLESGSASEVVIGNKFVNGKIELVSGLDSDSVIHSNSPPDGQISFTPKLEGSSTAGSHTYSIQEGYAVRQGEVFYFWAHVEVSSFDTNMAGTVLITGIPLPNRLGLEAACTFGRFKTNGLPSDFQSPMGVVVDTNSQVIIQYLTDTGSSANFPSSSLSGSVNILVSGSYRVDTENYPDSM